MSRTKRKVIDPTEVKINSETLLDELMFPAARYCIGRHTYVSSYAETYNKIIWNNQKAFNKGRLLFFARDIKAEISSHMNWWKNVKTENAYNSIIKYDSYFLLTKYLSEHPNCVFEDSNFIIDCVSGEVIVEKREKPLENHERNMPEFDLACWSSLASAIADRVLVKFDVNDGETHQVVCFVEYDCCKYAQDKHWHYEKRYRPVDLWRSYVPGHCIKSIEPLPDGDEEDN